MPKLSWNDEFKKLKCNCLQNKYWTMSVTSLTDGSDLKIWDMPFGFIAAPEAGHLTYSDQGKTVDFNFVESEESNHTDVASVSEDSRGSRKLTVTKWIDQENVLVSKIEENVFVVATRPVTIDYISTNEDRWLFGMSIDGNNS